MIIAIVATIALILVVGVWFVNQPKFGKNPSGERLERIKKSPNYQNGAFKNLSGKALMKQL